MKSRNKIILAASCVLALAALAAKCRKGDSPETVRIERGDIEVWSVYMGIIESQNVRPVVSQIRGSSSITEIVRDGSVVTQGMTLAVFDASRWEDDMTKAETDLILARADYESTVNAKLPLEMQDLASRLIEAKQKLADEEQALKDTRELFADALVPEYEVKQIEVRLESTEAEVAGLKQKIGLTERYLHPAAVQRAQAALDAASNACVNMQMRIESSIARAPCDGIAVHKPTNISGDYRAARVGDALWQGQVFMTVSDMTDLIARCDVPEQELTMVNPGAAAVIRPIAFPGMELQAHVTAVGAIAQQLPNKPQGARFFEVVLKIDSKTEGNLRSDMSAEVRVLSHKAADVLLIPRSAVWWEAGRAFCHTLHFGKKKKVQITLGPADDSRFELLDGLEPGQKVVVK